MTPNAATRGLPLIQSLGLGHSTFVMGCAMVSTAQGPVLVSAGGEGTLMTWDPVQSGPALCTLSLAQYGQARSAAQEAATEAPAGGTAADDHQHVNDAAAVPDGHPAWEDARGQAPGSQGGQLEAHESSVLSISAHPTRYVLINLLVNLLVNVLVNRHPLHGCIDHHPHGVVPWCGGNSAPHILPNQHNIHLPSKPALFVSGRCWQLHWRGAPQC